MSYSDHIRNTPNKSQKAALRGTKGVPGNANRYVTDRDPRMQGNPANHHTTHEPCGDDVIDHFAVVSEDPVASSPLPSPPCDSWWLLRNGTSPETFSLRLLVDGEFQSIHLGSVDTGSPTGGSGDSIVLSESVTVTHAQILLLNSTPRTIVPAPGSGFANLLVAVYFTHDYSAGAYSDVTVQVRYDGLATDLTSTFSNTLNQTTKRFTQLPIVAAGFVSSSTANKAIQVSTASNPTSGHAANTMKIQALYITVLAP